MSNIIDSINIVRKTAIALLLVVAMFAVASTRSGEAKAHLVAGAGESTTVATTNSSKLEHAYHPKYDSVKVNQVAARINNWMSTHFSGRICATEVANGKSYHRGCFWAEMDPAWSSGNWSTGDFTVTTYYGGGVKYTYQLAGTTAWKTVPHFAL